MTSININIIIYSGINPNLIATVLCMFTTLNDETTILLSRIFNTTKIYMEYKGYIEIIIGVALRVYIEIIIGVALRVYIVIRELLS